MRTLDYLDLAERKHGLTDYAMAKKLSVTRGYVSKIRTGRNVISDQIALQIAKMADVHPVKVLMAASLERSDDPEISAAWSAALEKISTGFKVFGSGSGPRDRRLFAR